jgi:hypothetical protein
MVARESTNAVTRLTKNLIVRLLAALCLRVIVAVESDKTRADEGGESMWLPGQFGSLVAVPTTPGWSLGAIYYHVSADEGASRRQQLISTRRPGSRPGWMRRGDLVFLFPTCTFASPVLGGQAAFGLGGALGRMKVEVDATLTGPAGGVVSRGESDSLTSVSDLYPLLTLKWKRGVHNFMAYSMVDVPVGSYQTGRLANIGINHWDAGGGYTYFNQKTGRELSAAAGLTYNFEDLDTDYRNGIDSHLDGAASQFLSPPPTGTWASSAISTISSPAIADRAHASVISSRRSRRSDHRPAISARSATARGT